MTLQCRAMAKFAVALFTVMSFAAAGAQTTTTTTLSATPASAANGSVFTMTATVKAGGTSLTGGTVTFRDTYNSITQVLGTVQVQSGNGTKGKAILKKELGGIGSHSIVATFNAPKTYANSPSSAQSVTLTGLYPTTASLAKTGGAAGNWSLTATIVGIGSTSLSPTGNVSVVDTSNSNYLLGVAGLGTGTVAQQTVAGSTSPVTVGTLPQSIAAGDFNGDGDIDLAVLNSTDNTVSILLGNGTGGFTATGTTYATGAGPVALVTGDFNGDGNLDLAVTNSTAGTISILLGNGNGTFRSGVTYAVTTPNAIAIGDFNGDGIPDLAITNGASQVNIMQGAGDGSFSLTTGSPFTVGNGASSIVAGDFNGDGNIDFAVTNKTDNTISVMLGNVTGITFTAAVGSPISTGAGTTPVSMVAAYFDSGTSLDLAVAESGKNKIAIFKGNGDGTFTAQATYSTGTTPVAIVAGDFNADGNVDLAVTNSGQTTASLLLGNGNLTFQAQTTAGVGTTPVALTAGDFNGDGSTDLAVANSGNNSVSILLNQETDTALAQYTGISIPGSGSNHAIKATYPGDTNFGASTSATISLASTKVTTSTLLSTSTTTPTYGQQVVLTATLTPPPPVGTLVPSGNITFKDGGTTIGTAALSSGVATLNITSLTAGGHSITAVYAGDTNFVGSTSTPAITITVSKATPVIAWANPAAISYGTLLWTTQLNATATVGGTAVAGTYTYTPAAGTILPVGSQTLSVTFTPTDTTDYNSGGNATVTIQVNQVTPVITWPVPTAITYGTPLDLIQLNATATSTSTVSLASSYNVYAAYNDGTSYSTGGFDGGGYSYSANSLGTSVTWNGVVYPMGPANAPDAVYGVTVPLPAGYFSALQLLGAMVNNVSPNYTFTVTYTDGTTTSQVINLSDWVNSLNWPGESSVKCNVGRNFSNGSPQGDSTCVYGYTINLNSSKIVKSVTLPNNRNIVILAMGLTSPPVPGTFTYNPSAGTIPTVGTVTLSTTFTPADTTSYTTATASVPLIVNKATTFMTWPAPLGITYGTPLSATQLNAAVTVSTGMVTPVVSPSYRVNALFTDGQSFGTGGFGGTGLAYSATQLGTSISWNGANFPLGTPGLPNGLTSATVALPKLNFYSLYLLGAGNGNQTGQVFTVTYTDGTTANTTLNLSNWSSAPQGYVGESLAAATTYADTQSGGTTAGTYNVYAYQIILDPTKTLQSLTLPNNTNVVIISMALSSLANPTITVPGTYVYTPPAGTILPVGSNTLSAAFTPTDNADYSNASGTVNILVGRAPLLVTANNQTITYGNTVAPYTYTITGFVNGDTQATAVTGAPQLTTSPTTPSAAGTYTITTALNTLAATNYTFTAVNGTLTINQAASTITWATPAAITYGTALSATQLNATATPSGGTFTYTPATGTILSAGTTTLSVLYTPSNANYATATATVQLVVNQAASTITWATPAAITYGTALSATQLNATATPSGGTFTYTPAAGTILSAGTTTLSVLYTPSNANYATATATVQIVVGKATPVITWSTPAGIPYGTQLSGTQLNATASTPGSFVYSPAAGTTPATGTDTLSVTFTPTDSTNYTTATATVQIVVGKATPVITWATPAGIPYGTQLSGTQLNATASTPGSFVYSPAAGTTPATGTDTLSVTFTPTDTTDYTTATATVQIVVGKATPVITWANPAGITYGTALSTAQLNATTTVAGTFAYTPAAGSVPLAGTDTLSVTFTPTDTTDYTTATATVQIVVGKATPVITWANPAGITYGTALSTAQLNATTTVAGSFVYTPAAGSVPLAGTDTLSVTFTPTDTSDYTVQTVTVDLVVNQAVPVITWPIPAGITYGTALSTAQLNATSSVSGSFVYTPATGSVPPAGTDTLSVTFTPADTANYTNVISTVTLAVSKANPIITWAAPAPITYGTALSATEFNATASVPGSFVYTPAVGSTPLAGTDVLSVTFTPTDTSNYTSQTASVILVVNRATPVISWPAPSPISYGTALSATELNATTTVPGVFVYTPPAGTILTAGPNVLSVTFTPTDTSNYAGQTATANLLVIASAPVINWANPASIIYGTPISSVQLNATATQQNSGAPVAGTFTYSVADGTVLSVGTQPITVTFVPTDTVDYTTVSKTVTINVLQATLIVAANDASKIYGTVNPPFTGTVTGAQNGDTFNENFSTSAITLSNAGTYAIVPSVTGNNLVNYVQTIKNGTLTINKGSVISTLSLSTTNIAVGLNVTMTVTLQSATSGTPTGSVSFFDNGNLMGTSAVTGNTATYSTTSLLVGTHVISTLYSGDNNFNAQTAGASSGTGTVNITPLDFSIELTSLATLHGVYGTSGTYTFHIAPIGGSYPGTVTFTVNGANGPIFATYTFSQNSIPMHGGSADITLTVSTHKLAGMNHPTSLSGQLSPIALGLFLIPLASVKRLRKSGRKLARAISLSALLLLTLGGIASLTGCGSGYPSVEDPITVTGTSNGIQHTVTVNYHIDKSPQ